MSRRADALGDSQRLSPERSARGSAASERETRPIDASYRDPIGEAAPRPKTGTVRGGAMQEEWSDDEMLPE